MLSPGPAGLAESFEGMHETLPNLLPHSKRSEVIRVKQVSLYKVWTQPVTVTVFYYHYYCHCWLKDDNKG